MRERSTLVSSMVLLSVLAAGSYWLAVRARLFDPVAKAPTHDVDYYADNFELVRMDQNGKPDYRLRSDRMFHYADDDSTTLTKPALTTLSPAKPIIHLTAQSGDISSGGDLVHLKGAVHLTRDATASDPGLVADASRMTLWPDDDIARTDVPVHAVHGKSTMDGDTMYFNNTDQILKLNDDVPAGRTYVTLEPRQKKPAPTTAHAR
jgi:lipopolysaccharide export system protein LptC